MIRGIRGAITIEENEAEQIEVATEKVVREMIELNHIDPELVAQVIITATTDIDAGFPAKALRNINGWQYVPVMCAQEIPVKGSLPKCIRVMMSVNTEVDQKAVKHVFLEKAKMLRPDLVSE